ncbi:chaperone NapD [Pseudoxanthomonas mexicana]|uniref:chaperone NapD n=1 Tax=Pseudoxanthomonas mexicana TaxID=128785 RepID=UPI00398AA083
MAESPGRELHIASFIVQHQPQAADALAAAVLAGEGLEIAIPGQTRSIVLCESDDQHALLEHVETLRNVAGVLNVALVYHHAEARASLDAPLAPAAVNGAQR